MRFVIGAGFLAVVVGAIDPFYGTTVVAVSSTAVALIYVLVRPKGVAELQRRADDCEERYAMLRDLYRSEGGVP